MNAVKQDIIESLNPADTFTLAMDEEIRKDGLSGSYGCYALEFDTCPDIQVLTDRIDEFSQHFPVSQACLKQVGKKFYWCKRQYPIKLFFHHNCPSNIDSIQFQQQKIDHIINDTQVREDIAPIEFHLISSELQHTLFTRWMHPFCDARGADLIIQYLCTNDKHQRQQFGQPETEPLVYVQLAKYRWWQKIGLLLKGKRFIDRLDRLQSIQAFECNKTPQRLNYRIKKLTEAETEKIIKQARQHVGLTGTSLYFIGCLMRALEQFNPSAEGDAFCTPYAFNLRKQKAITPVTGNHLSALFAQAPREIVQNREKLFQYLKLQNTEVIRNQEDYAFLPLMWAGTWLSLKEYGKTLRLSYGSQKERSSFWFSDIGRINIAENSLAGATITNIFHVCQVTTPPALAFLSCIVNNRLTLSYNFVEPVASCEQIEKLHHLVLAELLHDQG